MCIRDSDSTLRASKGSYVSRQADTVVVKGKTQPVLVHELLDFQTPVMFPERDLVLERYALGLKAYQGRSWQKAIECFQSALTLNPRDRLSSIYLERASYLSENEPADDWDGVWQMTAK